MSRVNSGMSTIYKEYSAMSPYFTAFNHLNTGKPYLATTYHPNSAMSAINFVMSTILQLNSVTFSITPIFR